jgi:hypothetical protein
MMNKPNFFLTAVGEFKALENPRACYEKARLRDSIRDDYMLVEIEPLLIGQPFGLGNQDIEYLILSTKHSGFTLYPPTEWPSHVYVTRILDDSILKTLSFTKDQVELLTWGMIFPTLEEALNSKKL